MRYAELLPKPFRNIYHGYQEFNQPNLQAEELAAIVHSLTEEIFRFLLVLPQVVLLKLVDSACEKAQAPFLIKWALRVFVVDISPASARMSISGGFAGLSVYCLIQTIAHKSLAGLAHSIIFGWVSALASEFYDSHKGLERYFLEPISTRAANFYLSYRR